jgi:hypothetical protein
VSFWGCGRSKGWCAVRLATTVRCEVGALGFHHVLLGRDVKGRLRKGQSSYVALRPPLERTFFW